MGSKSLFYRIEFEKIKIIVILYVKYMFKKVKKFEFRGRICEVVETELLNISHHIWYKNHESVKSDSVITLR